MPLLRFNPVPVYQWTHAEFAGLDPWSDREIVRWSVVVYQLIPESFVAQTPPVKRPASSERNSIPNKCVIGIYSREHNRYRVLPLALQDLWRAGKVEDRDLPRLLHLIEEPLRITDYPPGQLARAMKIYAFAFPVIALLAFMAHLYGAAAVLFVMAVICFGVADFWRQRRQRLTEEWLRLITSVSVTPA